MGPTQSPPGSCRPQMDPMLAPWTLLSGFASTMKWGSSQEMINCLNIQHSLADVECFVCGFKIWVALPLLLKYHAFIAPCHKRHHYMILVYVVCYKRGIVQCRYFIYMFMYNSLWYNVWKHYYCMMHVIVWLFSPSCLLQQLPFAVI